MTMLDRSRLDGQVRALITQRVAEGVYPVGQALPSEVSLAAELGVSRVTLRQALQSLEEDGLVVRRQGIGTFVCEPLPVLECVLHKNLGVTEMIKRSGLEPGTSEQWVVDPYEDSVVAAQLHRQPTELVGLERVRTANGRPIARTTDVFAKEWLPHGADLSDSDVSIYSLLEQSGARVRRGSASLVPTQADGEVAAALALPAGSVLLMLEQIDFDQNGQPVLFSRELWVRRAIRFSVDRSR